jgi:enoyl-CoA hydratase/carnithine racemase
MTLLPSPTPRLNALIQGPVGFLMIDNASRRNALDLAMWQAIPGLVAALDAEAGVRVIVLRGARDLPFAAGADISEFATVRATAQAGRAYERANEAAYEAISRCARPVIAMLRGFCLGGGFGLAVACDVRIAAQGTRFGIPAGRLGVGYPPSAMAAIVAAIGASAAKELIFTARQIDANEALAMGLVSKVLPDGELENETLALAHQIAGNAPLSLTAAKRAIDAASGLPGALHADALGALADACYDSTDYCEGRTAFLEKRKPRFEGR